VPRALLAATLAVGATLVALALTALGGASATSIEWTVRDLLAPPLAPVSQSLVIVARDAASEARLGSAAWDRAVLARVVTSLARGGAAAIALDTPFGQPSAPGRGGAASDVLFSHATTAAGNVVLAISATDPASSLAPPARAVGHTVVLPERDGVVRRVPLITRRDGREIPALGVALAALAGDTTPAALIGRIPTDRDGAALLRWAPDLQVLAFSEVWSTIERGEAEVLRRLVEGKTVLVFTEPLAASRMTPIGPLSDVAIHAELTNAVQTGGWIRPLARAWTVAGTLGLALLAAWLGLGAHGGRAALGVAGVLVAYAVLLALVPGTTGLALPVVTPLGAVLLAGGAALVWRQAGATRRLRSLEGEIEGIRTALARQESTVETLEEDLEAARAAVERSTGAERDLARAAEALREQLVQARGQEEQTRLRLAALERELRAAGSSPLELTDTALESLRTQAAEVGIITRDPAVLALFRDLQKAARASLPILITGEAGTGKELFARAAHRLSPRASGPFVAINAAAIAPELFESELFGHVRGSFTGAVADRKGHFEQADHGTLFLDEIGELRLDQQGKLLRVLQERTFHRVGATKPTTVDVRIVVATNRDLGLGVTEGWFREDLYFRLRGVILRLPPLRERPGDIAPLAERFLAEGAAEAGRQVSLSEAAVRTLERHDWPGNVRELQQCLRRAVALSERSVLAPDDLRLERAAAAAPRVEPDGDAMVLECLRQNRFDMQATARTLGWDRSTVTQRLKGMGFQALVDAAGDRARAAEMLAGDPALARVVELKLTEYHEHLLRSIAAFDAPDPAVAACRRRFKNLPDRHFRSLEALVRQHFK